MTKWITCSDVLVQLALYFAIKWHLILAKIFSVFRFIREIAGLVALLSIFQYAIICGTELR